MATEMSKVGKRGAVVIPASLRRRFGIKEGSLVIAEGRAEGVPHSAGWQHFPLRIVCTRNGHRAEFPAIKCDPTPQGLYARAKEDVRKMGLDPRKIPHYKAVPLLVRGPDLSLTPTSSSSTAYRLDTPLRKLFSLPERDAGDVGLCTGGGKEKSFFWAAEGRVGTVVQICRSGIGVAAQQGEVPILA